MKKLKLRFTTATIRVLSGRDLEGVGGGAVAPTSKFSCVPPDPPFAVALLVLFALLGACTDSAPTAQAQTQVMSCDAAMKLTGEIELVFGSGPPLVGAPARIKTFCERLPAYGDNGWMCCVALTERDYECCLDCHDRGDGVNCTPLECYPGIRFTSHYPPG